MKHPQGKSKTLKQLYGKIIVEAPRFVSIFTRVSVWPQIQLCDLTGLRAKYVCPRTNLRYHSAEVYERIRNMPTDTAHILGGIRALGHDRGGAFGRR
ncbi:INO80 complex subunit C [Nematocida sp. LUAm3]|nr:INO80 complex subunit C [Nematocida sp. LUAm3]KAI5173849.1 INO80 complex subunit C [Nematocida sp. LUAm2]KAI5177079.1 INO80 complex subunit C [Nematocida sp. LUAm1]